MISNEEIKSDEVRGTLAALGCYVFWGLCPIYWKWLGEVSSLEVICHRIIWCLVATVIVCRVLQVNPFELLHNRRARKFLIPSALLITINWSLYIYAVDIGHVIETAIGYYINPLVSIIFGIVVFKERLTRLQGIAVALCAVGILYFTFNYGQFPWIAIVLAVSFGAYGAVKKKGGYPPIRALAFESLVITPFALAIAVILAVVTGTHAFLGDVTSAHGWLITLLLVGAGPVTAIPLVLFATAANKIPLMMVGFVQYVSPTIALMLGVFLFGEPFTLAHAVCLGCIWTGLFLVSFEQVRSFRKKTR